MINSEKIIQAIRSNNHSVVLNELYTHVLPDIVKFIKSKGGSRVQAEDCFQDAVVSFISAIKANRKFKELNIRNYIFIAARNRWYSLSTRQGAKETPIEYRDFQTKDFDFFLEEEKSLLITQLFSTLGEQCKKILQLRIFENKKPNEIQELMKLSSIDVVKTTTYRCKNKLRKLLQERPHIKELLRS